MKKDKKATITIAVIICSILILSLFLNDNKHAVILKNNGRNFEKATVIETLNSDNNLIKIKITSGKHKGEVINSSNSSNILLPKELKKGDNITVILNDYKNKLDAWVYSK